MKEVVAFLSELRNHNEREWFNTHRSEWKAVQARFNAFVEELIGGISSFDSSVKGLMVSDCTYRINRDTRFSADKSPYKTHMGAYVAPRGKKAGYAGYYFHIEPMGDGLLGGSLLTAGLYCPEPVVLHSIRDEIFDNGAEIEQAVGEAHGFALCDANKLKRTPKGYPSGGAYDEMLKLKDVYLEKQISNDFLYAEDLLENTLSEYRRTQHFVEILNRAVQFAHEEMM